MQKPSKIDIYKLTNYTFCEYDDSWLSTWESLAIISHSVLMIQLPICFFGGYCILYKTPNNMITMKWNLLYMHIWSSMFDILLSSFITPYFLLPTFSGFPVGFLRVLGVPVPFQIYFGLASGCLMGSSVVNVFENRNIIIPQSKVLTILRSSKYYLFFTNHFLAIFYLIPVFLNLPDQEDAKFGILETIKCPNPIFFDSATPYFVLTTDSVWSLYFFGSTVAVVMFYVLQAGGHSLTCVYFLYFNVGTNVSTRTRTLQRRSFMGIVATVSAPLFCCLVPAAYALYSSLFDYYNQAFNNLAVIAFSFHGVISTFVLILVHHPYRTFLLHILHIKKMTSMDPNNIRKSTIDRITPPPKFIKPQIIIVC